MYGRPGSQRACIIDDRLQLKRSGDWIFVNNVYRSCAKSQCDSAMAIEPEVSHTCHCEIGIYHHLYPNMTYFVIVSHLYEVSEMCLLKIHVHFEHVHETPPVYSIPANNKPAAGRRKLEDNGKQASRAATHHTLSSALS
jgi:hypothetical protein